MNKIRLAIVAIVMLIAGISFTITGISDIIKLNGEIPDFNYDSMQNIKEGDLVQGYVWTILDSYADKTTTKTTMGIETSSYTSAEYFIMPLINDSDSDKELYITITAQNQTDRNTLYDICNATWEYYINGNTSVTFPEMGVVAKVKKLDDKLEPYIVDWFYPDNMWFESEAEARQHIIFYELQIYNPDSAYTSLIIGLVIIAVIAVIGVLAYRSLRSVNNSSSGSMPYVPQPAAPSSMGGISAPQSDFAENYTPPSPSAASPDTMSKSTAPQNSFSETYTPPSPQPIPDIPLPVQPDEFFDKSKPVSVPVSTPAPPPMSAPAPQPEIEIPQPVQPDEFFEKPEKKEKPKPVLVKPVPVKQEEEKQPKPKPEPESVSAGETINLAYAEEAVTASNMDGLDTASLSLDDLGYYDTGSGASDEEDDMFDFSNDDYGEIDVESIEISE